MLFLLREVYQIRGELSHEGATNMIIKILNLELPAITVAIVEAAETVSAGTTASPDASA